MPHFEQVHVPHGAGEPLLHRHPRIRLEQDAGRSIGHQYHHAVIVDVHRHVHPGVIGTQDLDHHAVERDPVARPRGPPSRSGPFHRRQKLEVQRPGQGLTRFDHQPRRKRGHHRRQSPQMIRVRVGGDHQRQAARAMPPQVRDDHAPPRVVAGNPRTAVDRDPLPTRRPQQGGVTLPHIQERYGEATTIVE